MGLGQTFIDSIDPQRTSSLFTRIWATRNGERWGLLILEGVVDLAAGTLAVPWPAITLVVLLWIIAVWAIVSGALMLTTAFSLNLDHGLGDEVKADTAFCFAHVNLDRGAAASEQQRGAAARD
jgi:hypothetical protein